MRHLYERQRGIGFVGLILVLFTLGCFVLFILTAFPLYSEYFSVKSSMKSVVNLPENKRATMTDIRRAFLRNAQINGVRRFKESNIKEFLTQKKSENGKKKYINIMYQSESNLFKNLYLAMKVNETMELPKEESQ